VRTTFFFGLITTAIAISPPVAAEPLRPGLYEIAVRVLMPNVGDAIGPTVEHRCLSNAAVAVGDTFSVMSKNNPLAACPRVAGASESQRITFQIVCEGPNMAKADASFDVFGDRFEGRIVMNMGGKNMTLSEHQVGRRIGDCP
jgi:hypothetical protein